jgi:hypothetical protein
VKKPLVLEHDAHQEEEVDDEEPREQERHEPEELDDPWEQANQSRFWFCLSKWHHKCVFVEARGYLVEVGCARVRDRAEVRVAEAEHDQRPQD